MPTVGIDAGATVPRLGWSVEIGVGLGATASAPLTNATASVIAIPMTTRCSAPGADSDWPPGSDRLPQCPTRLEMMRRPAISLLVTRGASPASLFSPERTRKAGARPWLHATRRSRQGTGSVGVGIGRAEGIGSGGGVTGSVGSGAAVGRGTRTVGSGGALTAGSGGRLVGDCGNGAPVGSALTSGELVTGATSPPTASAPGLLAGLELGARSTPFPGDAVAAGAGPR